MHRFFTYHHNAGPAEQHEGGYFHAGYSEINGALLDMLLSVRYDSIRLTPTDTPGNFRRTSIYNEVGHRLASVFMDPDRNLRLEITPAEPNPVENWISNGPSAALSVSYFLEGGHLLLATPGKDGNYKMSDSMMEMMNAARMFYDPNVVAHEKEGFLIERRGFRPIAPKIPEKVCEYVQLFDYFSSYENALASYRLQKLSEGYSRHYGKIIIKDTRLLSLPENKSLIQSSDFGTWMPEIFSARVPEDHFGFLRHYDPDHHPWTGQAMQYAVSVRGAVTTGHVLENTPRLHFSSTFHLQSKMHAIDTFLNFDPKLLQVKSFRPAYDNFVCDKIELLDTQKSTEKTVAEMAQGKLLYLSGEINEMLDTNNTYLKLDNSFYRSLPKGYAEKFSEHIEVDNTRTYITEIGRQSGKKFILNDKFVHYMAVLARNRQAAPPDMPYVPYRARVTYVPFGTARDDHPEKIQVNFRIKHLEEVTSFLIQIPQGIAQNMSSRFTSPNSISVTIIDSNGKRPILHLAKVGGIVDQLLMAPAYIPDTVVNKLTALYRNNHAMVDSPEKLHDLITAGQYDIIEAVSKYQGPNASQQWRMSR